MSEKNCNSNINIGNTFNGPAQVGGQIINIHAEMSQARSEKKATYTPEPLWRSPVTLGVLTWVSVITGLIALLPVGKILGNAYAVLRGPFETKNVENQQFWIWILMGVMLILILSISLRRITKRQTRHPLCFNLAISGYGKRLSIEKMNISKCPQCGGEMKYYNKAVEWVDRYYSDGKVKREVTKKIPVLECKRNSKHCYEVDQAEDSLD